MVFLKTTKVVMAPIQLTLYFLFRLHHYIHYDDIYKSRYILNMFRTNFHDNKEKLILSMIYWVGYLIHAALQGVLF
jgi:hypothetical protein